MCIKTHTHCSSYSGLVGGLVLPLLGAVPDGAIMLFSGLGDVEKAQETLSVGVGALAGSTIMLLTVPWAMSIYYGRVDFCGEDMEPNYKGSPKLKEGMSIEESLHTTGVALTPEIHHGAKMMMVTTLPYFLIQVPACFLHGDRQTVSHGEHYWAAAGFAICFAFFITYLYTQVKMSNDTAHKLRRIAVIKESLKKGAVSLSGALAEQVKRMEKDEMIKRKSMEDLSGESKPLQLNGSFDSPSEPSDEVVELLKGILGEAFRAYDQNNNDMLSKKEFSLFLTDFHEHVDEDHLNTVFSQFDVDGSNTIDFDEFISACYIILTAKTGGHHHEEEGEDHGNSAVSLDESNRMLSRSIVAGAADFIFEDEVTIEGDDEEEEEVPEDFTDLSPEEQQRAIKRRAFGMLTIGTALVLFFSDPMVDVLQVTADRIGVPAFYVSFILAPLASNASEVIASQYYAQKKTRKTITVSLTALEGAASMNNTFCLSIFMALIYFRGLAWKYSAETISIVLVQFGIGICALKDKMSTGTGIIILMVFPLSVVLVAVLEYLGMD